MNKYTTNKKYFEAILSKSTKKVEYVINDENLIVKHQYETATHIGFDVESAQSFGICKACGQVLTKVKDTRFVYPTVGMINAKKVMLRVCKKLYFCSDCKRASSAKMLDIEPYAQKTNKFIHMMLQDLKEQTTYSIVARRFQVSISNVIFHFDRLKVAEIDRNQVKHISIDEVKFIPSSGNYQCVIYDHDTHQIVDILADRMSATVKDYLVTTLPNLESMTQDFWLTYKNAVRTYESPITIIADRFHLVRFGMWGYNRTRIALQKSTSEKYGQTWRLQNISRKKLDKRGKAKVDAVLSKNRALHLAYKAKEFYLHIFQSCDLESYKIKIKKWCSFIEKHELTEFYFIKKTLLNWSVEIENMFTSTLSNGAAERVNRTIKQAKNNAYGFKNLSRSTKLIRYRVAS